MGSLGLDIGSAFVSIALVDSEGRVTLSACARHEGDIPGTLKRELARFASARIETAGATGSGAEGIAGLPRAFDPVVAIVEGTSRLVPGVRNILYVGAGSYHLVRLNHLGEYQRHTSNSACASGTGAFLDQQAYRLNFLPEELSAKAEGCRSCPAVATRCSVFAKTDMIHLQQDGFPPEDIAAGLCKGLSHSTVDALLKGQLIEGKTAVVGGVARNRAVVRGVEEHLGFPVTVPPRPELVAAVGAALAGLKANERYRLAPAAIIARGSRAEGVPLRRPLKLELSDYPEFTAAVSYVDEFDTEVSLILKTPRGETIPVALGIDIGSTSTKATLLDGRTGSGGAGSTARPRATRSARSNSCSGVPRNGEAGRIHARYPRRRAPPARAAR